MSRWFRHYAGMMRDEKLVRVAVKAKQPVERVVWVWGAILESAAEINDDGRYEFDPAEAAYFLRCDEHDLVSVIDCLVSLGRLAEGVVSRWADRQFNSDGAKERQRRYRERLSSRTDVQQRDGDVGEASRDVTRDVTPPSRDGAVTAQETETDTYQKGAPSGAPKKRASRLPADWQIPEPWIDEAVAAGLSRGQAVAEATRMLNWSLSDTKGAKLDWLAAWRNWFDRAAKQPPRQATSPPAKPRNAGELAFMRLNGTYNDELPDTSNGRLDTGNGRREIEGAGGFREPAFPRKFVS